MPLTLMHPTTNLSTSAQPNHCSTLSRGLPHLNHKTVRSLQQSIKALQTAIAMLEQEQLALQGAALTAEVHPQERADASTQIQTKAQKIACLQATLDQAELKLAALCA